MAEQFQVQIVVEAPRRGSTPRTPRGVRLELPPLRVDGVDKLATLVRTAFRAISEDIASEVTSLVEVAAHEVQNGTSRSTVDFAKSVVRRLAKQCVGE